MTTLFLDNKFFFTFGKILSLFLVFVWVSLLNIAVIFSLILSVGFKIDIATISLVLVLSLFFTIRVSNILHDFYPGSILELLHIMVIILCIYTLYGIQYSPILEIRQDPALYLFKALNIVNYGEIHRPLTDLFDLINSGVVNAKDYIGYGKIINGSKYVDGALELDFLNLPSFYYAFLGVINKQIIFLTPFFINLTSSFLMYFLFKKYISTNFSLLFTLIFFITPAILWFGRAPYSEPVGLMILLSIPFIFEYIDKEIHRLLLFGLVSIVGLMARIDFIVLNYIAIFFISYKNPKIGVVFSVLSICAIYLNSLMSSIYVERIFNMSILFKYSYLFISISVVLGFIAKVKSVKLYSVFNHKFFKYALLIVLLAASLLIFRDDVSTTYELKHMHGRIMRTYNETNMEKIFLIMPAFIVIFGLLNIPFIVKNTKNSEWVIIFTILFFGFLYYLFDISNSPQMYWSIRRYIYVFLPIVFISFVFFVSRQESYSRFAFALVSFLLVVNQTLAVKPKPEMKGLDKSVEKFVVEYPSGKYDLILYDKKLKYQISSILSYGKYQFIPVSSSNQAELIRDHFGSKRVILYIKKENTKSKDIKFTVEYTRVGENYNKVPVATQHKRFDIFVEKFNEKEG